MPLEKPKADSTGGEKELDREREERDSTSRIYAKINLDICK